MMDATTRSSSGNVLVVGAGPVGLTAAAFLTRHGVGCRVVDRSPLPTETSKALVLWQRTQEILDELGIVDDFTNAGMFVNAAKLHGEGHVLAHLPLTQTDTHFPRPLMLAQSETERLEAPSEIIKAKREVARIKTILRLREIDRERTALAAAAAPTS